MRHIARLSLMSLLCLIVVACGGGGGGGGGTSATPTGDGPGQRAVPGYALAVERESAVVAGAACTMRVTIAPESGQQPVTGVEMWLGTNDYVAPTATTTATAVGDTTTTWKATTTLPNPLPGDATVWLKLTTADGSVIEVGSDALLLATLPEH